MAVYYNKDIRWYVGAMSVAAYSKSATFTGSCEVLDTTNLATDGWVEVIGGKKWGAFDLSLMADFTDDGLDELLFSYLGTADVSQSFSIGSADGSPGFTMKTLSASYTPLEGEPGALAMARLSGVTSAQQPARGMLIHPDTTARTSSGTGSAWQVGAVSSGQKLYASLHVIAASGTSPTLDVKVQSDNASNFPSATDRITFTQATDETYQTSSVAGAITDDYWRVSYTIGGTGPSFRFAVIVGIG